MTLLWKIGGEAGFGIMTVGTMFAKLACQAGYEVLAYPEYPSLVRGGHNTVEVHFGKEIFSLKEKIDILVCLNEETYTLHHHRLSDSSLIIFDEEDFLDTPKKGIPVKIPFKKFIKEEKVGMMMANNIALGATLSLLNWDFSLLEEIIKKTFDKKGEEIIKENLKLAKKGYDFIEKNHSSLKKKFYFPQKSSSKKLVLTGNDAFSLATVVADCRLYCAYPMTPSSSVLHNLAEWSITTGMIVRHPEDEISAVNTAIGASFAGVRSAVGTSGGGFALMAEALSFSGITEIPLVVFVAQRPGPATGMPTWTQQEDLLFSVFAGHGEFLKIVLAAGDVEEMINLTLKAFDLADVYQTPVIVLSDKFLSESHFSLLKSKAEKMIFNYQPNRGKTVFEASSYLRYQDSPDGISPRLIAGFSNCFYQANSYEHLESGITTEDAKERKKQVDKRNRKIITYLKNHFQPPTIFGDIDASLVFVSWGSNKGAILSAMKFLKKKGISSCYYHFTHLYPLNEEKIYPLFDKKKQFILIENNSWGQFGRILRQTIGIDIKEKILKYNGRPFYPEEIISFLKK